MDYQEVCGAFVRHLEQMRDSPDTASKQGMVTLQRAQRLGPENNPAIHRYILPYLPDDPPSWLRTAAYLVAPLFAMHPLSTSEGNLGQHMAQLAFAGTGGGVTRRFELLLTAQPEDLARRLGYVISLLKHAKIPVNWGQLLRDLTDFAFPDSRHRVIQRWATAFYRRKPTEPAAAGEEGTPTAPAPQGGRT